MSQENERKPTYAELNQALMDSLDPELKMVNRYLAAVSVQMACATAPIFPKHIDIYNTAPKD